MKRSLNFSKVGSIKSKSVRDGQSVLYASAANYNSGEPTQSLQTVNSHNRETLAKFIAIAGFCWQEGRVVLSLGARSSG